MKKTLLLITFSVISNITLAQVGIGTTTPEDSAVLELSSTQKGFLPPRMSNSELLSITGVQGLMVYSNDENCLAIYNTDWINICTGETITNKPTFGSVIIPNDLELEDGFGISVAMSSDGTTFVATANGNDEGGILDAGSAYVFRKNGNSWIQEHRFLATDINPDVSYGEYKGCDISNDGNTVIVGAQYADTDASTQDTGAIYIYENNGTWNTGTKIQPTDLVANALFGASLAISTDGNTIAIGAPNQNDAASSDKGRIYLYKKNQTTGSWEFFKKIIPIDSSTTLANRLSLNSDGTVLVVGDPHTSITALSGYVFVYRYNSTTDVYDLEKTLSEAPFPNGSFGSEVSVSDDGNTILAAEPGDDTGETNSGALYVFKYIGAPDYWEKEVKLKINDLELGDRLGQSSSLSGDGNTIITSSQHKNSLAGATYVFKKNNGVWGEVTNLEPTNSGTDFTFGISVSLSANGSDFVVGAYRENTTQGIASGAVYTFK